MSKRTLAAQALLLAAVVLSPCAARSARAADGAAATAPATQPSSIVIPGLSDEELKTQLVATFTQIHGVVKDTHDLLDPKFRETVAPQVTPLFHKVLDLLAQVDARFPDSAKDRRDGRNQVLTFLDLLGDPAASKKLDELAASANVDESLAAKAAKGLSTWMRNSKDAAAQKTVLDQMEVLAKANPKDDSLAKTLMVMSNLGPANDENSKRTVEIVSTDLTGDAAKDYQAYLAQRKEADAGGGDLKGLENKPLVIKGTTVDGKAFTTADWKGKVILIDFWATWCGPCRGELPNVKKLYNTYHDKGFEVVGVSCDNSADDLTSFLKDDGAMPWPQIFDADHPGWSPIAKGFGINGIPTMFLIDKAGVLRSVEARELAKDLVPKLLEETPAAKK